MNFYSFLQVSLNLCNTCAYPYVYMFLNIYLLTFMALQIHMTIGIDYMQIQGFTIPNYTCMHVCVCNFSSAQVEITG